MGIFGDRQSQAQSVRPAPRAPRPAAGEPGQVRCDRCHVASAKAEVITCAGPVFLCRHHFNAHRSAILEAGHQVRLSL
jgi:hypothetical protein